MKNRQNQFPCLVIDRKVSQSNTGPERENATPTGCWVAFGEGDFVHKAGQFLAPGWYWILCDTPHSLYRWLRQREVPQGLYGSRPANPPCYVVCRDGERYTYPAGKWHDETTKLSRNLLQDGPTNSLIFTHPCDYGEWINIQVRKETHPDIIMTIRRAASSLGWDNVNPDAPCDKVVRHIWKKQRVGYKAMPSGFAGLTVAEVARQITRPDTVFTDGLYKIATVNDKNVRLIVDGAVWKIEE